MQCYEYKIISCIHNMGIYYPSHYTVYNIDTDSAVSRKLPGQMFLHRAGPDHRFFDRAGTPGRAIQFGKSNGCINHLRTSIGVDYNSQPAHEFFNKLESPLESYNNAPVRPVSLPSFNPLFSIPLSLSVSSYRGE